MSDGQLAMNTNLVSPGLFLKDSNGDLVKVGPVHVGTTAPNATPGAGGQAGNSKGEQWLDTSSSRYVFKIWDGTAWRTEDGEFVNTSGDTMTGALVHPLGAVGTPSITFTGDTNTGIYSPGADQVAISTNGTQRLLISSTGSIGIGTSSPAETLEVAGNAILDGSDANLKIKAGTTGTTGAVNFTFNTDSTVYGGLDLNYDNRATDGVRLFAAASSYPVTIQSHSGAHIAFRGSATERARIDSSGRLGLGVSSPTSLLHLADAGNITVGTTTGTKIGTATTQKLGFYNATPVVQPTAVADATTSVDVITQLNALLAKLRTLGIIAT